MTKPVQRSRVFVFLRSLWLGKQDMPSLPLTPKGRLPYTPPHSKRVRIIILLYQPLRGYQLYPIERRQTMTPTEMEEKAMQIFGQGMQ